MCLQPAPLQASQGFGKATKAERWSLWLPPLEQAQVLALPQLQSDIKIAQRWLEVGQREALKRPLRAFSTASSWHGGFTGHQGLARGAAWPSGPSQSDPLPCLSPGSLSLRRLSKVAFPGLGSSPCTRATQERDSGPESEAGAKCKCCEGEQTALPKKKMAPSSVFLTPLGSRFVVTNASGFRYFHEAH